MKKNVGMLDRIIRMGISVALIVFLYVNDILFKDTITASIILAIAVINIFVAGSRVCPLYSLANISTCEKKESNEDTESQK